MFPGLKRRWVLVAAIALHALSCAGVSSPPARLGLKLAPATLGRSLSLQQHLVVERQGRIDELDTALEIDPERLELVGLALGQRILSLSFDGRALRSWRHPLVPEQLRGEDVLEDLQLTLWPVEVIRNVLPSGWSIVDVGGRRTLSLAGEPVLVIKYSAEPRWSGRIELNNLRYQYRLTIDSLASGS